MNNAKIVLVIPFLKQLLLQVICKNLEDLIFYNLTKYEFTNPHLDWLVTTETEQMESIRDRLIIDIG